MKTRSIRVIKKKQIETDAVPAPEIRLSREKAERTMVATVSRWVMNRRFEGKNTSKAPDLS